MSKESKKRRKVAVAMEQIESGELNIGKSKTKPKRQANAIAIAMDIARKEGRDVTPKRREKTSRLITKKRKKNKSSKKR